MKYTSKANGKSKSFKRFTAADTTIIPCKAILATVENGDTIKIWERKLINKICPVKAIVSDDGNYIITFDEWYSAGYGENVVVIYNQVGDLMKRFRLDDISPIPLNNYAMSISSLWWSCGANFKIDSLEICFIEDSGKKFTRTLKLPTFTFED